MLTWHVGGPAMGADLIALMWSSMARQQVTSTHRFLLVRLTYDARVSTHCGWWVMLTWHRYQVVIVSCHVAPLVSSHLPGLRTLLLSSFILWTQYN